MHFYADTHTHTIASTHAFSTILENAKYAAENGIGCIAMTDHAPDMPDGPHVWHFRNSRAVPSELFGVRILHGIETDLLPDGTIDVDDDELAGLEWVIVSLHPPVFGGRRSVEEVTAAYVKAAQNPHVDMIGHSGLFDYPYDYEKAIKAFGELGKIVEINEHSFDARKEGIVNCKKIAELCEKHNVRVAINSDAHFAYDIGRIERSLELLSSVGFNLDNVVNRTKENLDSYLSERFERIKKSKEK